MIHKTSIGKLWQMRSSNSGKSRKPKGKVSVLIKLSLKRNISLIETRKYSTHESILRQQLATVSTSESKIEQKSYTLRDVLDDAGWGCLGRVTKLPP